MPALRTSISFASIRSKTATAGSAALAEKSLAQNLDQPSLIALAYTIERKHKDYYVALERSNKQNEITGWLEYFARTILEAQDNTIKRVDFYVAKAKLYDRLRGQLNERQERVVARMFREGIDGFKGGLSSENYISITKTSRATATRDLQDLVAKGVLTRTGELRHTRYQLNVSEAKMNVIRLGLLEGLLRRALGEQIAVERVVGGFKEDGLAAIAAATMRPSRGIRTSCGIQDSGATGKVSPHFPWFETPRCARPSP